jgi:hypothetical protein
MTLLAKVEGSFDLGFCVVWFKFLTEDGRIRVKDQIQLRTPDGHVKDTYVAGIERVKHSLLASVEDRSKVGISLPPDITKKDAPPGTEIWLLDSSGENS